VKRLFLLIPAVLMLDGCALLQAVARRDKAGIVSEGKKVGQTVGEAVGDIKDASKELSPENEYYVGRAVSANLLAKYDFKYLEPAGPAGATADYVASVGYVLAAAAEGLRDGTMRAAPVGGWNFVVLDAEVINAFGAPGGFVFVTRGALLAAKNEEEIAAMLAHEIAHVMQGHGLGSIKTERFGKVAGKWFKKGAQALTPTQMDAMTESLDGSVADVSDTLIGNGYSRSSEGQADALGQRIAAAAGYDPRAMISLLGSIKGQQATSQGGMLATHPSNADRVKKLEANAKKLGAVKAEPIRTERYAKAVAPILQAPR
jgi:predicted Zn-dependent protease